MRRSWGKYVIKRVLLALLAIFVISSLLFFLFRLVPGNPADRLAGPRASVADREQIREQFCLNDSLWEQYARCYLRELFLNGNLGISTQDNRPVSEVVGQKLWMSIQIVLPAELFAITLGIITGVIAAVRRRTVFEKVSTITALIFYSFPTQWFGLMLLMIFAGQLGWFPSGGREDIFAGAEGFSHFLDVGHHAILPIITLGLVLYADYTLIVRSAMLETLGEDYVLTARAKGLPRRRIVWRHAFRNASLPIVQLVALSLAFVVGGSILTETVFSWPGVGLEFYEALGANDWPLLNGLTLILVVAVVLGNLIANLLLFKLDPRITE